MGCNGKAERKDGHPKSAGHLISGLAPHEGRARAKAATRMGAERRHHRFPSVLGEVGTGIALTGLSSTNRRSIFIFLKRKRISSVD